MRIPLFRLLRAAAFLAAGALNGCSPTPDDRQEHADTPAPQPEAAATRLPTEAFTGDLDQIRERKILRALVVPSNTDFFLSGAQIEGLQAKLLREYEKFLNKGVKKAADKVRVRFLPVTFDRLVPELLAGHGDVAAAMLTLTPGREARVAMVSGKGMSVDEVVVRHRDVDPLNSIDDLAGREVHVLRGSSYAEHLRQLNLRLEAQGRSSVKIREADPLLHSEDILEMVNAGIVQLTVIDDYKARLWSEIFKDIVVQDDVLLNEGGSVGWAVRRDNPQLQASLGEFVKGVKKGTLLGNVLTKQYLTDTRWITNPTSASELEKLERVMALFQRYGERYDIDPLALLAQAYHESGLEQKRRSHRGAVGLMQLLPSTAKDPNVGIPDIHDIENNVHAGAKYLAFLRDRYFSAVDIDPEDRLAFAWAAYNAGPANVRRMRRLAAEMGLDENRWFGNVEVAAGKLIGRETVKYVADIKKYHTAYRLLDEQRQMKQGVQ
jgi:membrane-bound lytic murein transglycosylase MltF